jgi:hypothetical protein
MSNLNYVYKRTAGTAGFAGTWVSTSETVNSQILLKVQPYDGDGLSFIYPSQQQTTNVKFDARNYASLGPNKPSGASYSARRVNPRTLEITDKLNGKVLDTRQVQLSSDLKSLTITLHRPGLSDPDILVFERQ